MANALSQAGATVEPSEFASLAMDEHFTGLWTQRNPLRDADVPYLYRKYYSASRYDSMLDGINREINAKLNDARRPGTSVYNSQTFPAINSYYAFKWIQDNQEMLRVLADGRDGNVYDATPNGKLTLFTKSVALAKARFLAVGTTLYIGDGYETKKVVRSPIAWKPATSFTAGQYIVDSNGNLQVSLGVQTATIAGIQVYNGSYGSPPVAGQFAAFTLSTALTAYLGQSFTPTGLTTVPSINGANGTVTFAPDALHISLFYSFVHPPVTAQSPETGTLTSGTGITGGTPPVWKTTYGAITIDGGAQWICRGSSAQNWGGAGPANAPIVTQVAAPSIYPAWSASTWYAPAGNFIIFVGGVLYKLTTAGITAGVIPAFNPALGATTTDGTAVWTSLGPGFWAAATAYAVGAVVQATYTYYITVPSYVYTWNGYTNVPTVTLVQQAVTATSLFQCATAGTSGISAPAWTNGLGTSVTEITGTGVVWLNIGSGVAWPGATQTLSLQTKVLDSLQNVEAPQRIGETSAGPVTWNAALGGSTVEGNQTWLNAGPYGAANTGAWTWSYSGLNSITGEITSESPVSQPLLVAVNMQAVIQGQGLADTQFDSLILWRTAQGFSAPRIYLDTIPNPGGGQNWIYTDTTPDKLLNAFKSAPTADDNNPPPATATAPEYHCGRIWMIDGSYVRYSGGPDTVPGNGNSAFPPLNYYQLPEQPTRLKSITVQNGGLVILCVSNTYIILGDGTSNSPFLPPRIFMENTGLMNYDAVAVVGSTFHGLSNKSKVFSFDPANGYLETGFPIGDQLTLVTTGGISAALYDPAGAYVTWHEKNSSDTGVYVADGAVGWFRWSPIAPPESGSLWSPRAAIVGGTSAVQSIETAPGVFELLIGPASSGPIRKRDSGVSGDWDAGSYHGYPSWDVKGCISLCDTGEVADIEHIALKSVAVGSRPIVSLLLDELQAGVTVEGRTTAWDVLSLDEHHEDPPNLDPSITMFSDRYQTSATAITPKCESLQLKIDYGTQQLPDELLKFAIFGAVLKEKRQQ